MSITSFHILHLGQYINAHTFKHNIEKHIWSQYFNQIQSSLNFKHTLRKKHYKYHHIDNLVYQFDVELGTYNCYYQDIKQPQLITFESKDYPTIKQALSYYYTKHTIDYEFLPINKYYNQYDCYVDEFCDDKNNLKIIFESSDTSSQIKFIFDQSTNWSDKLLNVFTYQNITHKPIVA